MEKIILIIKYFFSLYWKIFYKKFWRFSLIKNPNYIIWKKNIEIWDNVYIWKYSFIFLVKKHNWKTYTPSLIIWNNVWIWQNLHISCMWKIIIWNSVMISRWVFIWDSYHGYEDISKPIIEQDMILWWDVIIMDWAFIWINVAIMPWVRIGKNAVIWANSVVTKDIPDFSVAVWAPAKVIKYYAPDKKIFIKK